MRGHAGEEFQAGKKTLVVGLEKGKKETGRPNHQRLPVEPNTPWERRKMGVERSK